MGWVNWNKGAARTHHSGQREWHLRGPGGGRCLGHSAPLSPSKAVTLGQPQDDCTREKSHLHLHPLWLRAAFPSERRTRQIPSSETKLPPEPVWRD